MIQYRYGRLSNLSDDIKFAAIDLMLTLADTEMILFYVKTQFITNRYFIAVDTYSSFKIASDKGFKLHEAMLLSGTRKVTTDDKYSD